MSKAPDSDPRAVVLKRRPTGALSPQDFLLSQVDLDGALLKALGLADNVQNLLNVGNSAAIDDAMPSLRSAGISLMADGRAVGRLGTVVDHVDLGPVALALLKRGVPADTDLVTGGDAQAPAVIDADSLPPLDEPGAGRAAVQRLRGTAR